MMEQSGITVLSEKLSSCKYIRREILVLCVWINILMIINFINRCIPSSDSSSYLQMFIPEWETICHNVNQPDQFINTLTQVRDTADPFLCVRLLTIIFSECLKNSNLRDYLWLLEKICWIYVIIFFNYRRVSAWYHSIFDNDQKSNEHFDIASIRLRQDVQFLLVFRVIWSQQ